MIKKAKDATSTIIPRTLDEIKILRCKEIADNGDIDAAYQLGYMYALGYKCHLPEAKEEVRNKNVEEGIRYLYKAAMGGNFYAILTLISVYIGDTLNSELSNKISILEKKRKEGDVVAECVLSRMYLYGYGVEKDAARAFGYAYHAANFQNASALYILTDIYLYGNLFPNIGQNLELAEGYVKDIILKRGETSWTTRQLVWIAEARGDEKQILEWTQKLASFGDSENQLRLGQMYEEGKCGLEKDLEKAKHWYTLAAAQGGVDAKRRLDELEGIGHANATSNISIAQQLHQHIIDLTTKPIDPSEPTVDGRPGIPLLRQVGECLKQPKVDWQLIQEICSNLQDMLKYLYSLSQKYSDDHLMILTK